MGPAQYFHVLRRQIHRLFRKPLVVFSPKSLLRFKSASSALTDFTGETQDRFLPYIGETQQDFMGADEDIKQVIFCSGKVYYDLVARREEVGDKHTVIHRIEQLHPVPLTALQATAKKHPNALFTYVSEEALNMSAFPFLLPYFAHAFPDRLPRYVGRKASAAPAGGSFSTHKKELEQ